MSRTLTIAVLTLLTLSATALFADEVRIDGRVVGPDGAPVAGAHVGVRDDYADKGQQWTSVTTAEDGGFALIFDTERVKDSYGVAAIAEGFGLGGADAKPGETVEIALPAEGEPITGTVVDADGVPIDGAEVTVWGIPGGGSGPFGRTSTYDWEHAPAAITGGDGRFSIGGLPPDATAWLRTDAEGYAGRHETQRDNWPRTGDDISIELQREAVISGRLTRDGEPLEGVRIGAQGHHSTRTMGYGDAVTGNDGAYTIRGLAAGTYNVIVDAPPEWTAVAQEGIVVESGQHVEGRDFEAIEGVVVRGTVTWADTGEPIPDVWVGAYGPAHPSSTAWVQVTRTDETGQYLMHLPPGLNRVYGGTPEGGRDREPREYKQEIAPDDEPVFDFRITRAPDLVIRVVNPDGTPAPGVDVYWCGGGELSASRIEPQQTNAQGEVAVVYRSRGHSGALAYALDEERGLVAATVVASADEAGGEVALTLQEAATATVAAIDGEAAPVTDAVFRVWFDDASPDVGLPINVQANADGVAEIAPLPPGIGMRIGPDRQFARYLANRDERWQAVELQPGEVVELAPLTIIRGGFSLRGSVIDEAGEPVEGATVQPLNVFMWSGEPAVTDAEGRFEVKGLSGAQDQAIVAVSPDGTRGMLTPVDPQNAYEPTIQLAPLATIIVKVLAADGRPLAGAQVEVFGQGVPMIGGLPKPAIVHARDVQLDADGKARIEHLLPGLSYVIALQDPAQPGRLLGGQEQVTLYGGEEPVEVTIDLGEAN